MPALSPYNSNNRQTIDSFNQNNSTTTEQSNKAPTIAQRATNLAYQTVMTPVNFGVNFFKGAAIWTGVKAVTTQGESLSILYKTFFNPDCIKSSAGFTPMQILSANRYVAEAVVIRAPIINEIFFRGLLQDIILKRGVEKVVAFVSPKHAELVNSKAYTAARILITSALFSYYSRTNYLDREVLPSFLLSTGLGLLKEKYGLTSAIGAHMLNAFVPMARDLFSKC